ncbi:putative glycerophosphodiester phosphodiesterase [Helianthus debilis subsp. tardiflorus]
MFVGIGPWKDIIVPVKDGHLQTPTDLVSRAHAHDLQVHQSQFDFQKVSQDHYVEFDYWTNRIGVDGLFTDFPGSLHLYQEWTSSPSDKLVADKLSNEMVM